MAKSIFIFDFDGVVALNTEMVNMQVIADIINQQLPNNDNIKADIDWCFKNLVGFSGNEIISKIQDNFGIAVNEIDIIESRAKKFEDEGKTILKKDKNLVEFLETLKGKEIEYCIATSSSLRPLKAGIKALDLDSYFNDDNIFIVDKLRETDKNANKKDLYNFIQTSYINSNEFYCIEDSKSGVGNAERAGIKNIIVFENEINKITNKNYYGDPVFKEKVKINSFNSNKLKLIGESNEKFNNGL